MHDFDDTVRHQHKFRIRGKWELILVMFVVIAGIIVTTIAVLKAKERRDTFSNSIAEDGSNPRLQVIDSSSPRFDSDSTFDTNVRNHNINNNNNNNRIRKGSIQNDDIDSDNDSGLLQPIGGKTDNHDNGNKRNNRNNPKNRYQAEKEFTDSENGEFLSESRQRNKQTLPSGETTLNDLRGKASNVETTKVLMASEDYVTQPTGHRAANSALQNDGLPGYPPPYGFIPSVMYASERNNNQPQQPQRPRNVEYSENGSGFLLATEIIPTVTGNKEEPKVPKINQNRPMLHSDEPTPIRMPPNQPIHKPPPPPMSNFKPETKPPNMATISRRNHQITPSHGPSSQDLLHAIATDNGNYLSQRELMWLQQNRPELFAGMLEPAFGKLHRSPRERRDLVAEESRNRRKSVKYYEDDDDDDDDEQNKNNQMKEYNKKSNAQSKSNQQQKSARRRKNRYSVTNNDDEDNQIFRDPSIKKRKRKQKKYINSKTKNNYITNKNKYSNEQESKNVEKFDILGSGNFEIIRGGILEDNNKDKRPAKIVTNTQKTAQKKGEASQRKNDEPKSYDYEQNLDDNNNNEGEQHDDEGKKETEDDTDAENFEPFNFDLFGSDPILGFQGYDNFGNSNKNGLNNIGL